MCLRHCGLLLLVVIVTEKSLGYKRNNLGVASTAIRNENIMVAVMVIVRFVSL